VSLFKHIISGQEGLLLETNVAIWKEMF